MSMNGKTIIIIEVLFLFGIVNIVNAAQNECFPDWNAQNPIIINGEKNIKLEFTPGNSFSLESIYQYSRECQNNAPVVLTWQALKNNIQTDDIVFDNKNVKKTIARVNEKAQTGDYITIRAILIFAGKPNGLRSEKEISVFIVSKLTAPIIKPSYGIVESHKRFNIGFGESKAGGSGNNFIRNCSLIFKDEQGKIIDTDEVDTILGKPMPEARLTPNDPGNYQLIVSCTDNLGTTETTNQIVSVWLADSDTRSSPFLIVNKTLNCVIGDCVIDFSRTNDFKKGIKGEICDITNGKERCQPCGNGKKCNISKNVSIAGVYKFKLKTWFDFGNFVYSRHPSEEIIVVIVKQKAQAQLTAVQATPFSRQVAIQQPTAAYRQPAATTAQASQESKDPCGENGEGCKTSPGVGGLAFFAAFALLRKIKFNIG